MMLKPIFYLASSSDLVVEASSTISPTDPAVDCDIIDSCNVTIPNHCDNLPNGGGNTLKLKRFVNNPVILDLSGPSPIFDGDGSSGGSLPNPTNPKRAPEITLEKIKPRDRSKGSSLVDSSSYEGCCWKRLDDSSDSEPTDLGIAPTKLLINLKLELVAQWTTVDYILQLLSSHDKRELSGVSFEDVFDSNIHLEDFDCAIME
ncbi:hypothetical protein QAD02_021559 [Eretmocerus hayati]|uniref:Uncharacterized protein n=1 Tax=Eretmocerus hayati TaxID=131215 RepID=A0ACC2PSG5_9HYME|nr:hypothetical protein QAD02_021559 [Eretmocerus hayati]